SPGKTHSNPRRRRAKSDGTFGVGPGGETVAEGWNATARAPMGTLSRFAGSGRDKCPGVAQPAPPLPDCRCQATIASARLRTPSFRYRLETWLRTVFS